MTRVSVAIAAFVLSGSIACDGGNDENQGDTTAKREQNNGAGDDAGERVSDSGTSTSGSACPNGIVEGDYNARSINELEALSDCTEVSGMLSITTQDATNLDALSEIRAVGGAMVVSGLNVVDLDGLNKLATVGGDLYITGCIKLTNLDALSALTSVAGDFTLRKNQELCDVSGLSNLTSFDGALTIEQLPSLATCDADKVVEQVGMIPDQEEVMICGTILDECGGVNCSPST